MANKEIFIHLSGLFREAKREKGCGCRFRALGQPRNPWRLVRPIPSLDDVHPQTTRNGIFRYTTRSGSQLPLYQLFPTVFAGWSCWSPTANGSTDRGVNLPPLVRKLATPQRNPSLQGGRSFFHQRWQQSYCSFGRNYGKWIHRPHSQERSLALFANLAQELRPAIGAGGADSPLFRCPEPQVAAVKTVLG